ncbi:uncharacterized protein LOC114930794 [Nylanderia fulva]|uniref:uncharacterized protein LOC114930794 n=1 Tax=Nylanderia fulva TaxID=613905 RepID=UPI0010FB3EE7|nr:uncharacterized protein LOC114930794 [Nylanderia fulva]
MVERFHRSLKSPIRCHASTEWVDILPTVLGLRASVKEDLKTSAAELVYGTPIRLPGEFFIDEDPPKDPQIFIEKLRKFMRKIRPTPPAHHIRPRVFSYKDLFSCSHVFVRVDAVKKPLDCPHEGPYEIIERISDRVFKLKIKGEEVTISTERLKPAYQELIPRETLHVPRTYPPQHSNLRRPILQPKRSHSQLRQSC